MLLTTVTRLYESYGLTYRLQAKLIGRNKYIFVEWYFFFKYAGESKSKVNLPVEALESMHCET
jgi:hypothetical protein